LAADGLAASAIEKRTHPLVKLPRLRWTGGSEEPIHSSNESYDRLVRNDTECELIAHYIEMNRVRAGLAAEPEEFAWSSARPIVNRPQVDNLPHI